MKRVNKEGPIVLGEGHHHSMLDINQLATAAKAGTLVDVSPSLEFAKGHVAGSINIPIGMLAAWAGWLVDYDLPTFLICKPEQLEEAARILHKIGVEEIAGGFNAHEVRESGVANETYTAVTPAELFETIDSGDLQLIDVRSRDEWNEGHIEQAEHRFLGRLPANLGDLSADKQLAVHCLSGGRSAIAVSVLQAAGFKNVLNLSGGYTAWKSQGLPSVKSTPAMSGRA
jgi:hydroxyacylglutathione hydrolase